MIVEQHRRLTVCVLIPTYNRADMVGDAIRSALAQTRVPDEILVVDDGSTDNTAEVLAEFGAPVRVLRKPNGGVSSARNLGLNTTQCDAVTFLDSDDLLAPKSLETLSAVLETRPDVDIVYSDTKLFDKEMNVIGLCSTLMPGPRPSGMILGELARRGIVHLGALVRRTAIDNARFDETLKYAEDRDFWRQLAARCRFQFINEPLLYYRYHDSMATTRAAAALDGEIELQRRVLEMPEFTQLSRKARARVLCSHGANHALRGHADTARRMFGRSVRTNPLSPEGYVLGLLSLLGNGAVLYAIQKRRQVIGHQLALAVGVPQDDKVAPPSFRALVGREQA